MGNVILRLESIQERAKSGKSKKCAVDGCENEKKILEARTCPGCTRAYPGIAKRVDRAVEDYKKTAFVYESKKNARAIAGNGSAKLGPVAWKALQQEIKTAVSGQEVSDELIVRALQRRHPEFSEALCQKAVGNFRKWQRFLSLVKEEFEIEPWLGEESQKAILVGQIQDSLENTEFANYSREVISQACFEIFPIVRNEAVLLAEKLAEQVTVKDCYFCSDLKSSAYEKACEISDDHGRIEGYAFKKLLRAVAERMTGLRKENQTRKKLEALEAKKAVVEEGHKKSAATKKEQAIKKDEAVGRNAKKEERKKKILSRSKIEAWKESNGSRLPWIIPVENKDEAFCLDHGQLVILNGAVSNVDKASGGSKSYLKQVDFEVVFEDPANKAAEKAQKLTVKRSSLATLWVMLKDKFGKDTSSEAEKVFNLTLEQMADDRFLDAIYEKELVGEAEGSTLYEKKSGQLVEVGRHGKPSTDQKKRAKAVAKARANKTAKQMSSDFARVVQSMSSEVACQPAA